MSATHLRIYDGPPNATGGVDGTCSGSVRQSCTVPLVDILPLLADAVQSERTWLGDFEDDEITISMDLYEVILAYQHFRRPSA